MNSPFSDFGVDHNPRRNTPADKGALKRRREMAIRDPVVLFMGDAPVLSSLQFSLAIEGFEVRDGAGVGFYPFPAAAMVIDQGFLGDGLTALDALRAQGWSAPAIVLATNPTSRLHVRAASAQVAIVEKPLQGGELGAAIHAALAPRKAA